MPLTLDGLTSVCSTLAPADHRTIAEWAEQSIILGESNAEPGPLQLSRTPYLNEIINAFTAETTQEITLVAGTQVGKTTAELLCMSWAIDQRPAPMLWVTPTEKIARRFSRMRIMPLFASSPVLSAHIPNGAWEQQILEFYFKRMTLILGWANSPAVLASNPMCYLMCDEIDKYPPASSREAEPLELARERVATFRGLSRVFKASTPTIPEGAIWREWECSDRRMYLVPCVHCGQRQSLEFAQVKWPEGERDPQRIAAMSLAWYECVSCGKRLSDHDKLEMVAAGQWEKIDTDAIPSHLGFKINALYSPWRTFSDVAAKFLSSHEDRDEYRNFVNSWMAEPWQEKIGSISVIVDKESESHLHARGSVPDGARFVTVGLDWHGQNKGFYWSAWGFGAGRRAWLLDFGRLKHIEQVNIEIDSRQWQNSSGAALTAWGGVDLRYQTPDVYDWVRLRWPGWRPVQGEDTLAGRIVAQASVDYVDKRTGRHFYGMQRLRVHTGYFKDLIASGVRVGDGLEQTPTRITLCRGADDLVAHLGAEHKIHEKGKELWVKRYGGAPNHWLDTTVIAMAVAELAGWSRLAEEGPRSAVRAPLIRRPSGEGYSIRVKR